MHWIRQALVGITGTFLCSLCVCGSSEVVGGGASEPVDRAPVGSGTDGGKVPGGEAPGGTDGGSGDETPAYGGPTYPADFRSIPYSLIQSVDDVGWKSYDNNTVDPKTHKQIEARNTYVREDAKLSYYQDMADIGRLAGTRLHAVVVLQDWDYDNTIVTKSKYNGYDRLNDGKQSAHKSWMDPSPQPMSKALTESIARLMLDRAAFVELGMHGVSHEHYTDVHDTGVFDGADEARGGGFARAEFAHLLNDDAIDPIHPTWGWDNGVKHMECFKEIYERFFPPPVHSFVRSFVAPAHAYYYNQDSPQDPNKTTSDLLRSYGIKYVDNDKRVSFLEGARQAQVTNPILHGVSFLDRPLGTNWSWHGEIPWHGEYTDTPYPRFPDRNHGAIEAHFPNLWDSVAIWVSYLKEVNNDPDRYLARNTVQNHSQYYYSHQATLKAVPGHMLEKDANGNVIETAVTAFELDTRNLSDEAYDSDVLGPLVLKTPLGGRHISRASIDKDAQIVGTWEDDFGYGYLVIGSSGPMGRLRRGVFTLIARLGDAPLEDSVNFYKGTFNVYGRKRDASGLKLTVEMYGTQDLHVVCAREPRTASSSKPAALRINRATWDAAKSEYILNLTATDIQGVTGVITIQ
ncbi:MAG: hypothetical protein U1A78_30705 [Polyangia bacterium]